MNIYLEKEIMKFYNKYLKEDKKEWKNKKLLII
jgi:hypothetical protein